MSWSDELPADVIQELEEWYCSHETEITDAELDAMWVAEQERRDRMGQVAAVNAVIDTLTKPAA